MPFVIPQQQPAQDPMLSQARSQQRSQPFGPAARNPMGIGSRGQRQPQMGPMAISGYSAGYSPGRGGTPGFTSGPRGPMQVGRGGPMYSGQMNRPQYGQSAPSWYGAAPRPQAGGAGQVMSASVLPDDFGRYAHAAQREIMAQRDFQQQNGGMNGYRSTYDSAPSPQPSYMPTADSYNRNGWSGASPMMTRPMPRGRY